MGKCWLKYSDSGRQRNREYDSGKVCLKAPRPLNCKAEEGFAYIGNNLHDGFGLTVRGGYRVCNEKCAKMTGCRYWSYRARDSKCWLKYSDRGRQRNREYDSGKVCLEAPRPLNCKV